jgi:hypothetical protein
MRRKRAALMTALMLLAGSALAVDTWEPYPSGPATLEFYATRYGEGAPGDSLQGFALVGGPAWGLMPTTHVYLFLGMSNSDLHLGGVDFLSFGLFRNLYDGRVLDLDAYAQLDAYGPGLTRSARLAGLEYNLDLKHWGLFARTAWTWENDGADAGGKAVVGRRGLYTWGGYIRPSDKVQILAEMNRESLSGFASLADESRTTSWALGYNRQMTEQVELILEARVHEAVGDADRVWDFTLGAVTVW